MEKLAWPSDTSVERCLLVWKASTPAQRQELTSVEGDDVVLYLRIVDAMLAQGAQQACDRDDAAGRAAAVAAARASCGLEGGVEYSMQRPRSATLSLDFCARDGSFERLLARSVRSREEYGRVLRATSSGRAPRLEEISGSWDEHARDVCTLALAAFVRRSAGRDEELLARLCPTLARPAPCARPTRPSPRGFGELKQLWDELSIPERAGLAALSGGMVFYAQACDLAVALQVLRHCACSGEEATVNEVLARGRRAVRLDCIGGGDEGAVLSEAFVADPGCLEHLQRHAVRRAEEKDRIVQLAAGATAQTVLAAQASMSGPWSFNWEDAARAVFTLMLEAALQRCGMLLRLRSRARQHGAEKEQEQEREKARAARRRRAAKAAAQAATKAATAVAVVQRFDESEPESEEAPGDDAPPPPPAAPRPPPPPPPLSPLRWEPVPWSVRATFVAVQDDEEAPRCVRRLRSRSAAP
jgi:hypothetical protein